ncbi:MAG: Stk1 family PASTA domain-containing Ser/Thr kinase [Bacteroides sp.]|nr:Stk1 family PASTA domain-containing Ser/Thr kinase [Bacteroides sp.]
MDNNIGKKLDGRYELLELIGVGGMADIYKARDITEDRVVAVKILKNEFVGSEDFIRRFRNESKAIALLSHPNIVKIYDVGFTDKLQFIVMEYIDGITLTEYISKQGVLKWKDTVHFTMQILKALQHAHDRGIVHRDIKPQNVMLLSDGTIKVMDFGIARFNRETDKTMSEKAIGSVHYISPEQARGDVTDERSDIYSIGIMMYEMLTGKKPFDGDSPVAIALMHMQSGAKKMSEINNSIPEGLEEITEKAMQKEPSKRYQTAGEMMKDIEEFKQNPSIVFEYKYFSTDGTTKYFDKVAEPAQKKTAASVSSTSASASQKKGYSLKKADEAREEYGEDYDDEDYDEDYDDEVAPRRSPLLSVLFAVTAVFVIVAAFVVYKLVTDVVPTEENNEIEEITVPTLVGLTEDEMRQQYSNLVLLLTRANDPAPAGEIIYQSIGAGTQIKSTQQITVTVSLGPKMEEIDEYSSRPKDEAVIQLKNQGFKTDIVWVDNDSVPRDNVIRTDPPARTRAEVGTTVTIYVSQGPSPTLTVVPNFKNLTEATAKQNAERNDLVLLIEYIPSEDGSVEKGRVISQSIEPNEKVDKNTVVTLYVSNGETPQKTSDLTFSINSSASGEFKFRYYIDGVLQEEMEETRDISLSKQIVWEISGTGTVIYSIVVESVETGESKTMAKIEVDFDADPIEKKQIELNGNVFRELQAEAAAEETTTVVTTAVTTPPVMEFETEDGSETEGIGVL